MKWKLQELCLRRIIEQFEIYTPFYESEDGKLKLSFEFLLRKYSAEIISELYDRKQLKPMYANILVNRYLTSINTDWFQTNRWEIISAKLAAIGFALKKVYVHTDASSFPWKDVFRYLPNLEIIWFFGKGCSDEVLKCVAMFCPNIVEIHADLSWDVSVKGIKHLGMTKNGSIPCPKLKTLSITDWQTIEFVLDNFPYIEVIVCRDLDFILYQKHKRDVLVTRKTVSYNLTCLKIDFLHAFTDSECNNFLKVCLSVCPHLKTLQCEIQTEEHLDTLSNLKNLTKLDVKCRSHYVLNLNGLLKCVGSTLKSLSMSNCRVSLPLLAESCPLLEELDTHEVDFQSGYESSVPVFHNLLSGSFSFLTRDESFQEACVLISASYRLANVVFYNCHLSRKHENELLEAFSHCPLKSIEFGRSCIEFYFAEKILRSCPNLSVLKLRESFVENPELRRYLNAVALSLAGRPFIHFSL